MVVIVVVVVVVVVLVLVVIVVGVAVAVVVVVLVVPAAVVVVAAVVLAAVVFRGEGGARGRAQAAYLGGLLRACQSSVIRPNNRCSRPKPLLLPQCSWPRNPESGHCKMFLDLSIEVCTSVESGCCHGVELISKGTNE